MLRCVHQWFSNFEPSYFECLLDKNVSFLPNPAGGATPQSVFVPLAWTTPWSTRSPEVFIFVLLAPSVHISPRTLDNTHRDRHLPKPPNYSSSLLLHYSKSVKLLWHFALLSAAAFVLLIYCKYILLSVCCCTTSLKFHPSWSAPLSSHNLKSIGTKTRDVFHLRVSPGYTEHLLQLSPS